MDQRPIAGKLIRVYDPPLPLDESEAARQGVTGYFRDFDATKVDVAPDGTMTLSKIESTGEEVDFQSGRKVQGFRATLLAVIAPNGRIRAETVDVEPAQEGRRLVTLADGTQAPNESILEP